MLDDALAVRQVIHGVLMDMLGLGVLITGESGIGKSECALDLVVRGHRLVADDTVEVRRRGETERDRHLPGADAASHGGARPRRDQHPRSVRRRRDAHVQARRARRAARTMGSGRANTIASGSTRRRYELFGLKVPLIRMPVAPGRSLAILVEVAARNQLLRTRGLNAARDLADRLEQPAARERTIRHRDAELGGRRR